MGGAAYVWDASGRTVDVDGLSDNLSSGESYYAGSHATRWRSHMHKDTWGASLKDSKGGPRGVFNAHKQMVYIPFKTPIPISSVLLRFG